MKVAGTGRSVFGNFVPQFALALLMFYLGGWLWARAEKFFVLGHEPSSVPDVKIDGNAILKGLILAMGILQLVKGVPEAFNLLLYMVAKDTDNAPSNFQYLTAALHLLFAIGLITWAVNRRPSVLDEA